LARGKSLLMTLFFSSHTMSHWRNTGGANFSLSFFSSSFYDKKPRILPFSSQWTVLCAEFLNWLVLNPNSFGPSFWLNRRNLVVPYMAGEKVLLPQICLLSLIRKVFEYMWYICFHKGIFLLTVLVLRPFKWWNAVVHICTGFI